MGDLRKRCWVIAILIVSASGPVAVPQRTQLPLRRLGVDAVGIDDGPRLLGSILHRDRQRIVIVVRRRWLSDTYRRFSEEQQQATEQQWQTGHETLLKRIDRWKAEAEGEQDLLEFVDRERQRLTEITAPPPSPYLIVTVPAVKVRRFFVQPWERKRPLLLAWEHGIAEPEKRSAVRLVRELQKRELDPTAQPSGLWDLLPPQPQREAEWMARQAIVEYHLRQRLDFQGIADELIRTDPGGGPDRPAPEQLLVRLLSAQVRSQLTELLDGKPPADNVTWFRKGIDVAERAKIRGFRATRVIPDLARGQSTVESLFVAQLTEKQWRPIWARRLTRGASGDAAEEIARIEKDPQIARLRQLVKSLGLDDGQLRQAIGFGAATMVALQAIDGEFFAFRDRYIRRLDGPPIP